MRHAALAVPPMASLLFARATNRVPQPTAHHTTVDTPRIAPSLGCFSSHTLHGPPLCISDCNTDR